MAQDKPAVSIARWCLEMDCRLSAAAAILKLIVFDEASNTAREAYCAPNAYGDSAVSARAD